jgi:hypothetical protein
MSQSTEISQANLLPIRVETLSPEYDWPEIWRIARIKGLVREREREREVYFKSDVVIKQNFTFYKICHKY